MTNTLRNTRATPIMDGNDNRWHKRDFNRFVKRYRSHIVRKHACNLVKEELRSHLASVEEDAKYSELIAFCEHPIDAWYESEEWIEDIQSEDIVDVDYSDSDSEYNFAEWDSYYNN